MRLIDADELQQLFNVISSDLLASPELTKDAEHMMRAFLMVTRMIQNAPTIEAEPVWHGHWNKSIESYKCSECGDYYFYRHNCCPSCGAKMDEVTEE